MVRKSRAGQGRGYIGNQAGEEGYRWTRQKASSIHGREKGRADREPHAGDTQHRLERGESGEQFFSSGTTLQRRGTSCRAWTRFYLTAASES